LTFRELLDQLGRGRNDDLQAWWRRRFRWWQTVQYVLSPDFTSILG
jgi:hypothetical protein